MLRACVFVIPFVPSPSTSPSAAEVALRLRLDEEVLDAPEELRQPVVGVGGAQEEHGQETRFVDPRKSHKTVTCHGRRVMEPVSQAADVQRSGPGLGR